MNEPKRGDWLRLVRRNRWDSEHLRSHVGELGEVTVVRLAAGPRDAHEVRLSFRNCQIKDGSSTLSNGCVQWVSTWRCDDE